MYEVCVLYKVPWREMVETKIERRYIILLKIYQTS